MAGRRTAAADWLRQGMGLRRSRQIVRMAPDDSPLGPSASSPDPRSDAGSTPIRLRSDPGLVPMGEGFPGNIGMKADRPVRIDGEET
jgi:hypothetical protein